MSSKARCARRERRCASPPADRRHSTARISGPTASTARWKTCSSFRTRWRSASPASSSRHCKPPRSAARPTGRRTTSPPTISTCARLRHFLLVTKERMLEALGLLEQAIAIDPHYGPALAWAAICHMRLVIDGWAEDPETSRRKAIDLARQALAVARERPGHPCQRRARAGVFGEDIDAAIGLIDRSLALNPSFARGWYVSGVLRVFAGQPDLAIEHFETSLRLSPRERIGHAAARWARPISSEVSFDEARRSCSLSMRDDPVFRSLPLSRLVLCAYGPARRSARDRRTATRQYPHGRAEPVPFRTQKHRELLLSGLRLAAGEEA